MITLTSLYRDLPGLLQLVVLFVWLWWQRRRQRILEQRLRALEAWAASAAPVTPK